MYPVPAKPFRAVFAAAKGAHPKAASSASSNKTEKSSSEESSSALRSAGRLAGHRLQEAWQGGQVLLPAQALHVPAWPALSRPAALYLHRILSCRMECLSTLSRVMEFCLHVLCCACFAAARLEGRPDGG